MAAAELVPTREPPPHVVDRLRAARVAVEQHQGVGLWVVVQAIRDDGFPELADAIVRDLVERVVAAAAGDPVVFAQLVAALRSATPAGPPVP
jgi:hypothetical protein